MIALSEEFAQDTVDREGDVGAAWLAELPGIVEELLGRRLSRHGVPQCTGLRSGHVALRWTRPSRTTRHR